ncbi:predicted protein [Botrytis cinerea T4]|uniref:Uncharacterized protein n=1 Tax=Botryotinia fuckeliana (strain T4) TaxID=999810 RepID=G2YEG8_BOTF4|nr:predicted protein [Botrytis cinerea T4]
MLQNPRRKSRAKLSVSHKRVTSWYHQSFPAIISNERPLFYIIFINISLEHALMNIKLVIL